MKTIKRLSVVFALIVAATISSCGGSDDDAAPAPSIPANGTYINATADGAAFTTVIMGQSAGSASRIGTGADNIISVLGGNVSVTPGAEAKTISITLRGITAPGTFAITPISGSNMSFITSTSTGTNAVAYSTSGCAGTAGTVTVTSVSATKIEGTFSFTGKNDGCTVTKSVTAGQFRGVFN